ncbi:hypothetical protein [Roseivivax sediminis]|uniref:hypothetical protein n=1 Tax=Roseivivax sediminis TaxID=936889 RepID=UPI00165F2761|nr:hypothetical protein [Roseivivax sediminis]
MLDGVALAGCDAGVLQPREVQHGQEGIAHHTLHRGSRVAALDVHKKTYSVALFNPQDGPVETWTCPAGEDALAAQLSGLRCRIKHVVYESGPSGFARACTVTGTNKRRLTQASDSFGLALIQRRDAPAGTSGPSTKNVGRRV